MTYDEIIKCTDKALLVAEHKRYIKEYDQHYKKVENLRHTIIRAEKELNSMDTNKYCFGSLSDTILQRLGELYIGETE